MNDINTASLQRWLRDYCNQSAVITGCVVVGASLAGENIRILAEWPERSDVNLPLIDAATISLKRKLEDIVVPPVMLTAAH